LIDNITLLIAFVGFLYAMILVWAFPKIESWSSKTNIDQRDNNAKLQQEDNSY